MSENVIRLTGWSTIVTGAGRGIGRILALTLGNEGARVIVSGRNGRNLKAVADEIRSVGGKATVVPCDVTRQDQAKYLAEKTLETYGTIDLLVNNAGIPSPVSLLVDAKENDWDAVMKTNVKGVFLVTRAALPIMMENRTGHIVTVSSTAGTRQSRNSSTIPYSVSKWAVEGFTYTMAMQMKSYGIRFNNIIPGPTLNDFQKGRSTVERLACFPGGMRRNEWIADSFRFLVCESGDLTGACVSAPEWDTENGIHREPISEMEIRAFLES